MKHTLQSVPLTAHELYMREYHLTGMAAVVVIGLPLILGMLSAKFGL